MKLITLRPVNLRPTPAISSPVLAVLPRNTLLDFAIGDQRRDEFLTWWSRVQIGGRSGWVAQCDQQQTPLIDLYTDTNWGWSLRFVLSQEGGLANDTNDAGGLTKFGIAQRFHPNIDVANLTLEHAKQIYFDQYWVESGANEMSWGLCIHHFDFAVNAGCNAAQNALNESRGDVGKYAESRRNFYRRISGEDYQRSAWLRRVDDCEQEIRGRYAER